MSLAQRSLKRSFDLVVAFLALIVLSPLLLVAAVLVKATSHGPVLYRDIRSGKDGHPFEMLKFRTMIAGASSLGLGRMVAQDDWRITRVGKVLRRTTFDEVPQLLNVIKGEMSIVGPRAATPEQMARCSRTQCRRLEVRPGMAGWAWIHGRNNIPWSDRMQLDVWYVDNWSFVLDLKILVRSIVFLVKGDGIYGPEGVTTDVVAVPGSPVEVDPGPPAQVVIDPRDELPATATERGGAR